jgi:hypothetical protein
LKKVQVPIPLGLGIMDGMGAIDARIGKAAC